MAGEPLRPGGSRKVVFDDPSERPSTPPSWRIVSFAATPVEGPCIIEFPGQSVVVPPNSGARADALGNLHVRFDP